MHVTQTIGTGLLAVSIALGTVAVWKASTSPSAAPEHAVSAPLDRAIQHPVESVIQLVLQDGQVFAYIRIPRLGQNWRYTVVEGVTRADLTTGTAHFPGTALPGQPGNFAVAGHTIGGGHPFHDLRKLQIGDPIYIDMPEHTYVYYVTQGPTSIAASDTGVIAPIPGKSSITLVSCLWPDYDVNKREAVSGVLG